MHNKLFTYFFQVANCVTGASLHQILEPVNPLKGAIFEYVLVNIVFTDLVHMLT